MKMRTYTKGQRVQMHPATDRWMMGDRYGVVISGESTFPGDVGDEEEIVRVKLDKSGKSLHVPASLLLEVM